MAVTELLHAAQGLTKHSNDKEQRIEQATPPLIVYNPTLHFDACTRWILNLLLVRSDRNFLPINRLQSAQFPAGLPL